MCEGQAQVDSIAELAARISSPGRQEHVVILRRAALLPANDRHILQLVLSGRHSLRAVAALARVSPGWLCRRINGVKRRLCDPVVAAIAESGQMLTEKYRQVGIQRFLLGRPMVRICSDLNLGRTELAEILAMLRAWAAGGQTPMRKAV